MTDSLSSTERGAAAARRFGRDLARWRLAHPALALAATLVACGPATTMPIDGGDPDAPVTGPLSIAIEGPAFAFVGVETCYRPTHNGGSMAAAVEVVWGDGARETLSPDAAEGCHTFTIPGPLVLGMGVDARGMHADATLLVHVVFAPAARRPTASGTIAFDAARREVWTVEPDADLAVVIAAGTGAPRAYIPVGDRPRTLALAGDRVLVTCQGDGTLHVLGPGATDHTTLALGAGSGLFGVLVDPRESMRAYATLQASGELVTIDLAAPGGPAVAHRLRIGRDPRALAMRDDGTIVVTRWRSTLDAASVVIVDASDPAAPVVVGDTLLPREEGRDSDTDSDGVLSFLDAIALAPDGGRAVLGALKANVVAGTFRTTRPLTTQTTARGSVAEVLLGAGPGEPGEDSIRRPLDDNDYVSSLVFSPMGETIYLTVAGAEIVLALDAFSFDTIGSIDDVGHATDGLALDEAGTTLFVHAPLSREVRAYDVSDLSTNPLPRWTARTVEAEPLAADVLAGAILFSRSRDPRMSRTRYLSCASCHRDGEGDGLVWDFTQRGEGRDMDSQSW